MADLAALRELYAFLQENPRIFHAKCGELELHVAPVTPAVPSLPDDPPLDEREAERRAYETLLYSSGADVSPFLTRRQ